MRHGTAFGFVLLAVAGGFSFAPPSSAETWSEFGIEETSPDLSVPVREPLLAFLFEMADADSLGRWPAGAIASRVRASGRDSKFPLDQMVAIERRRPDATAAAGFEGAEVRAEWRIIMLGPQEQPMPYAILGYHPGSLRMAGEMVLLEMHLGDLELLDRDRRDAPPVEVRDVRIFALVGGYLLLDADGLVDAMLGKMLDDSWVLGFVTGRQAGDGLDEKRLGVGVLLGRDGRHIFGELDLAGDRVLPHGGAIAAALSRSSRRWLDVSRGRLPRPWAEP